ncbi:MAG: CoA transferase [Alphaproteobacteria bacterium]|nr:CoA transferase [Alphaproteobacteria bacterium]
MAETSGGALAGLKVVDLSRVFGGPLCTQLLGDHGAEIIKVEPPQGDETRTWGPPFRDGVAAYFIGVNRNKRSIGLDLAQPRGRAVVLKLLENADVVIENFKIGTMERWGLGYHEVLAPKFPRLVYCRISGFGADGPLGGLPGYDGVAQALSGLMSVNGTPASGAIRIGVAVVDQATGYMAAFAIMAAIHERTNSGRGQFIETTLYDNGVALVHPQNANWFMTGKTPTLTGNSHPNVAPYDRYETRTRPIFLAALNNGQFRRLCAKLGRPELGEDPRFRNNADRVANRVALEAVLIPLFAAADGENVYMDLLEFGVPAATINDVPAVLEHPHTRHRAMVIEEGGYRGTGFPAKLGRTPASLRRLPPAFSGSGREILAEAGYSRAEIEALAAEGVLVEQRRAT